MDSFIHFRNSLDFFVQTLLHPCANDVTTRCAKEKSGFMDTTNTELESKNILILQMVDILLYKGLLWKNYHNSRFALSNN